MNWDDLRIVAAVSEAGTYAGAGIRLRIDETTVARRLARIERALGVRLFDAADGMRRPTDQCRKVLDHVGEMSSHVAAIGRVREIESGPSGRFRIASTTGIAEEVLAPNAERLLSGYPGLTLEFLISSGNVIFSRWEADIAIRLGKPARGDFTISRLADIRLYLVEPAEGPVSGSIVCSYPATLDRIPEAQFLKAKGLHETARCITDNAGVIRALIRSRRAVGVLPAYFCQGLLADRSLRLIALPRRRDVWLLTQPHLKRDRGARAVIDWIRACFQEFS